MKAKDFIVEKLNLLSLPYSECLVSAEMEKVELLNDDEYSLSTSKAVDLFFYNIIPELLLLPNSISEGGYSISYDKGRISDFYQIICNKLGKENTLITNRIKDISKQW